MGTLATGAALGAGMYAGQALAGHLMGGRDNNFGNSNAGNPNTGNPNLTQVGSSPLDDQNFGVRDAGSWDDNGASGWDDSGGGDFMNDV